MSKTCTCNRDDIGDIGHDLECPVLTTKEVEGWEEIKKSYLNNLIFAGFEEQTANEVYEVILPLLHSTRSQIIKELCEKVEKENELESKQRNSEPDQEVREYLVGRYNARADLLTHLKGEGEKE